MKKQKMEKRQNGITLIALVITIIVMLILAGVSINLVTGENGILKRATNAVEENKKVTVLEEAQMAFADWQMDYITDGVAYDGRYAETPSGAVVCASGRMYVIDSSNSEEVKIYEASLSANGDLGEFTTSTLDKTSQIYKAIHPEEQAILKGDSATYEHVTGTWGTGYVIKEKLTGDEFVWIPVVSDSAYVKKSGARNYHMSAQGIADHGRDVVTLDVSGDNYGEGYFITSEETERVAVNKAGGFYVSRYEVGIPSIARDGSQKVENRTAYVSIAGAEPVRNISQAEALAAANNWKTNGVQSGLITGTQWDTMCKFIGWSICDSDCTSWGNYCNAKSKEYNPAILHGGTDTDNPNREKWVLGAIGTTGKCKKPENYICVFPTGAFENENGGTTAQKNIYDVAGNVWEWTTETLKRADAADYRVFRGGCAIGNGWDGLATYRGSGGPTLSNWQVGFRAVLYVK